VCVQLINLTIINFLVLCSLKFKLIPGLQYSIWLAIYYLKSGGWLLILTSPVYTFKLYMCLFPLKNLNSSYTLTWVPLTWGLNSHRIELRKDNRGRIVWDIGENTKKLSWLLIWWQSLLPSFPFKAKIGSKTQGKGKGKCRKVKLSLRLMHQISILWN